MLNKPLFKHKIFVLWRTLFRRWNKVGIGRRWRTGPEEYSYSPPSHRSGEGLIDSEKTVLSGWASNRLFSMNIRKTA